MQAYLLKNGRIIDIAQQSASIGSILVQKGIITHINPGSTEIPKKVRRLDLHGQYISPGFIDAHIHIESSMMPPLEFAYYASQHGTTTILTDPHEIANVAGILGIRLWLKQAHQVPLDMYIGIPSCVPATNMEHSGATIGLSEIKSLIYEDFIYGLGEMMNFPGIIHGFGDARTKVDLVYSNKKLIDGHCPGLSDTNLLSYISNGKNDGIVRIMTDHESTTANEAIEKINAGMYIALRYGSATRDLDNILPELIRQKIDLSRCMLCSDDLSPTELYERGHIDRIIERARDFFYVSGSYSHEEALINAIRLATDTTGHYLESFLTLTKRFPIGRIQSGYAANLVVFEDQPHLHISHVFHHGTPVISPEIPPIRRRPYNYKSFFHSINLSRPISTADFVIPYSGDAATVSVHVIGATSASLLTENLIKHLPIAEINNIRQIVSDPSQDILKIGVFERHHRTGAFSIGFVHGFQIHHGSIASTIAHDNHNLIIVGTSDDLMAQAGNLLTHLGGGMLVLPESTQSHDISSSEQLIPDYSYFPLPIAGLMATAPIETIVSQYRTVKTRAQSLGTSMENVFMSLSFMALPVIPALKITDMGLIDVEAFRRIDLLAEGKE